MLSKRKIALIQKNITQEEDPVLRVLQAWGEPTRLRICKILMRCRDLCVTDIAAILRISVPAVSQQLKVLEIAGVVVRRRDGQMICYEMREDDPLVRSLQRILRMEKRKRAST